MPETNKSADTHRRSASLFRPASHRDLGLLAAVGIAVCCGLPLLIGAGTLAAAGAILGSAAVVAVGVVLAVGTAAWSVRRRRAGHAACCPPQAARAPGDGREARGDRGQR